MILNGIMDNNNKFSRTPIQCTTLLVGLGTVTMCAIPWLVCYIVTDNARFIWWSICTYIFLLFIGILLLFYLNKLRLSSSAASDSEEPYSNSAPEISQLYQESRRIHTNDYISCA